MKRLIVALGLILTLTIAAHAVPTQITTAIGTESTYGQVDVSSTATLVAAYSSDRRSLLIVNQGSVACWVGTDASVTTSTGVKLTAGNSMVLDRTSVAIYAITETDNTTVGYIKE